MNKPLLAAALTGLALLPFRVAADEAQLRVALPAAPALVEVQPGVQVIADLDLEVFQVGGAWWMRTDAGWWSARRTSEPFVHVAPGREPVALRSLERGRYRFVKAPPHAERPAPGGDVKVDRAGVKVEPSVVAPRPAPPPPAVAPAPAGAGKAAVAPATSKAKPAKAKAKGTSKKKKSKKKAKGKRPAPAHRAR
jgi:hypothetical protein